MVYGFLNVLYPRFLYKEKYPEFAIGFAVLLIAGSVLNWFAANIYFDSLPGKQLTTGQNLVAGYSFLWSAVGAGGIALGIKCAKARYLQEKENEELTVQKTQNEIRLTRTPVHFNFLFKALDRIRSEIELQPEAAPDLIIRLSDILRHLLYNGDKKEVLLEDEIVAVENFFSLMNHRAQEGSLIVVEKPNNRIIKVVPHLLFHFFENLYFPQTPYAGIRVSKVRISVTDKKLSVSVNGYHVQPNPQIINETAGSRTLVSEVTFDHDTLFDSGCSTPNNKISLRL